MSSTLRHFLNSVIVLLTLLLSVSHAQITLDGSMGVAGSLTGPNYTIGANLGQTRGGNLFHSFGLFNVLTNQSATFTGPNTISNILGRVTGGQPSTIDGQIRSTIPNASLYLMNPAGILFGPNASLDVQGSFHVTTADYLKFADGAKFHADLSRQSTLTTAPVSAFGFLSQNPAGIDIVQNSLQVPTGKTLSVIAGDINVVGDPFLTSSGIPTLAAPAGKFQLASVGSPGEVPVNVENTNLAGFERLGETNIFNSAYLDASGNGGGAVIIRGGRLFVDTSLVFADNLGTINGTGPGIDIRVADDAVIANSSFITADSLNAGRARDLQITAELLQVNGSLIASRPFASGNGGNIALNTGTLFVTNGSFVGSTAFSSGNAGNITVAANSVTATNGSQLFSNTSGAGNAGTVQITANDSINLDGASIIGASSELGSTGNAGHVAVQARNVTVANGSQLFSTTSGNGNAGDVQVNAADTISFIGNGVSLTGAFASAQPGSSGNAGSILVQAQNVTLTDRARLFSGTFGPGDGGQVNITATETVTLAGGRIFASAEAGSTGNAGSILVNANNLVLSAGAQIFSGTSGSGNGGNVEVIATGVALTGHAVIGSSSSRSGVAGNVTVKADNITASGEAVIVSDTSGSGDAGNVMIQAKNLTVNGGARIDSDTSGSGNGGKVEVAVTDSLILDGSGAPGTGILGGNHLGSTGKSADITVSAKHLTVTGGASISATTSGAGSGGTVRVTAGETIVLDNGDIIASGNRASSGNAGNIIVESKNLTLNGGGQIASSTFGSGEGGTVQVTATDTIAIAGNDSDPFASAIIAATSGTGKGGDVIVAAKNLTVTGKGGVSASSFGQGDGGRVQVTASEDISLRSTGIGASGIFAGSELAGNAGDIIIQASNITVAGSAQINNGTFGAGDGGKIQVTASDSILLDGTGGRISGGLLFAAGIASGNQPGSTGKPGNIEVTSKNLTILGGAGITSETFGPGTGATVKITSSDTLTVAGTFAGTPFGSDISTSSFGTGDGGSIELNAGKIHLRNGAVITATSSGAGNAGNINIQANEFRSADSSVTTEAIFADGGNIHLKVGKLVELVNSQITATVKGGEGKGGNISIDSTFVVLNNSQITANAFGGPGGNIKIVADNFLASPDSTITASSALSTPGTVDIQAPITDLSGSLAPLPESIVQATSLLRQSCAARYGSGKLSSLASLGRGGMPLEPDGFMPSPLYRLETSNKQSSNDATQTAIAALRPSMTQRFSINAGCS